MSHFSFSNNSVAILKSNIVIAENIAAAPQTFMSFL